MPENTVSHRTVAQLLQTYSGKRLEWDAGRGLKVHVIARDAALAYGREQVLVEPVAGRGKKWVAVHKCELIEADVR